VNNVLRTTHRPSIPQRRSVLLPATGFAAVLALASMGFWAATHLRNKPKPAPSSDSTGDVSDPPGRPAGRGAARVRMAEPTPVSAPPVMSEPVRADPVQGARAHLDEVLGTLERSREAKGAWLPKAQALLDAVKADASLSSLVSATNVRCFGDGCSMELSSGDSDKAQAAVAQLDVSEQLRTWAGGIYRFGPFPAASGQFKTNVILMRL
jgi:hypothetical protein